ncbi:hypothetical protein JCM8097_009036 [Rhodosporidiobolus ruineniae]
MSTLLRRRPFLGLVALVGVPSAAFLAYYVSDLTNRYPVHLPRPGSPLLEPVQAGHKVEGATVLVAKVPERVLLAASPSPLSPEEDTSLPDMTTAYLSTFLSTPLQWLEALLFSLSPWTSSSSSSSSLPPYSAGQAVCGGAFRVFQPPSLVEEEEDGGGWRKVGRAVAHWQALPGAVEALNSVAERWGVGSRAMSGGKLVWAVVRVEDESAGEGAASSTSSISSARREQSAEMKDGGRMVELRFGSSIEYPPSRPSAFAPQLPDEKPDTGSLPRLAFELHMLYARLLLDGTVGRFKRLARKAEREKGRL